jgi:hypothetical protein
VALIRRFEERALSIRGIHDSVECGYAFASFGDSPILQLETYGSPERKLTGKPSQVVQFDADAAAELIPLLMRLMRM